MCIADMADRPGVMLNHRASRLSETVGLRLEQVEARTSMNAHTRGLVVAETRGEHQQNGRTLASTRRTVGSHDSLRVSRGASRTKPGPEPGLSVRRACMIRAMVVAVSFCCLVI